MPNCAGEVRRIRDYVQTAQRLLRNLPDLSDILHHPRSTRRARIRLSEVLFVHRSCLRFANQLLGNALSIVLHYPMLKRNRRSCISRRKKILVCGTLETTAERWVRHGSALTAHEVYFWRRLCMHQSPGSCQVHLYRYRSAGGMSHAPVGARKKSSAVEPRDSKSSSTMHHQSPRNSARVTLVFRAVGCGCGGGKAAPQHEPALAVRAIHQPGLAPRKRAHLAPSA